MEHETIL